MTCFSLDPAGTHRGRAIVDDLIAAKHAGVAIDDVVWDPGYSLCAPGTTHHKLAEAGIHQTFQVVTHQRGSRPFSSDALLIDGQLYSSLLPEDLRDLAVPPRGASEADKLGYEAKFNRRARWRMVRHAAPDADGATRWRCPFCAGMLRGPGVPEDDAGSQERSARPSRGRRARVLRRDLHGHACRVALVATPSLRHDGVASVDGAPPSGQSANAALKGAFADLSRGFVRVFGVTKITAMLGFTIAGYNLDRIRSFRAKQRAEKEEVKPRSKRRSGTWRELVTCAQDGTASSPDPSPD